VKHLQDEDMDEAVEYVTETLDVKEEGFEAFSDVFARFQTPIEEDYVSACYLVWTLEHCFANMVLEFR